MLARLPHHGIAGVVVGQDEHPASRLDPARQLQGLGQGRGQRLVADHVEASFQECRRDRQVQVIGRDDRDHVDGVGAATLPLGHLGDSCRRRAPGATPSSAAEARERSAVPAKHPGASS